VEQSWRISHATCVTLPLSIGRYSPPIWIFTNVDLPALNSPGNVNAALFFKQWPYVKAH
jgi:hypothetical protein